MAISDLPQLIRNVHQALSGLATPVPAPAVELVPAVPIRLSVKPDYIVCLEDGKKLKMLKRHLMTAYGLTPDDYRTKWGLPADYPMVAPNYAEARRQLASQLASAGSRAQRSKASNQRAGSSSRRAARTPCQKPVRYCGQATC